MKLETITPLLLTRNEEANIADTLDRLAWAGSVVVIDSFSTDDTVSIANAYPNVSLTQRVFTTHAAQWNFGLSCVQTPWVLTLDADYKIDAHFLEELQSLTPPDEPVFYFAPLNFCLYGRRLYCSVLPARPVLYRPSQASYFDDGHTQRLSMVGAHSTLLNPIFHDDRKSLRRWFSNQLHYAQLEAQKLYATRVQDTELISRLRRIPFLLSILMPLYILFIKKGVFEFWQGWLYAAMRSLVEIIISLYYLREMFSELIRESSQKGDS